MNLDRPHPSSRRGDSRFLTTDRKRFRLAPKAKDFTNQGAYQNRPLTEVVNKQTNRRKSSVRSKVEHPFLTLKRLWGFAKVRYRGLTNAMLAMLNGKWGRSLTRRLSRRFQKFGHVYFRRSLSVASYGDCDAVLRRGVADRRKEAVRSNGCAVAPRTVALELALVARPNIQLQYCEVVRGQDDSDGRRSSSGSTIRSTSVAWTRGARWSASGASASDAHGEPSRPNVARHGTRWVVVHDPELARAVLDQGGSRA